MKEIALKFLLTGGHYFVVGMPEQQAKDVMRKWMEGEYTREGPKRIGEVSDRVMWSLHTDHIVGIHQVEIPPQQQQLPGPMGPPATPFTVKNYPWTGMS